MDEEELKNIQFEMLIVIQIKLANTRLGINTKRRS